MIVTRHYDHDRCRYTVRIDDAQPREQIVGELVRQIAADECEPWATVTNERPLVFTFADDYGHRFVYRVGDRDPVTDVYEMEWPD
ncbi:MAG: hypothetical protein ACXVGE_17900 [Blastococcus sp.]